MQVPLRSCNVRRRRYAHADVYEGRARYRRGWPLRGRRALLTAVCSASVLAALLALRLYPVSMVGVAGQSVQNTPPPTLGMLAFAVVQCALAVAAASALSRWLANSTLRRALAAADRYVMGLNLWHMVPVIVVSLIAYPTGMLPQPAAGSATWWWWRPVWVAVLSAVTTAELTLIAWRERIFTRALPTVAVRLPAPCSDQVCWLP